MQIERHMMNRTVHIVAMSGKIKHYFGLDLNQSISISLFINFTSDGRSCVKKYDAT